MAGSPPRFISFEGSEGCGKSTQLSLLHDHLRAAGHSVLTLREPGGTPLGESIRHLLKHDPAGHGMSPEAELLLFAASRADLVRRAIRPALDRGDWVLCDRFHDSTTVYQGIARGLPLPAVHAANSLATGPTLPTLTLVLDLDPGEARRRMLRRPRPVEAHDRMEAEPPAFYQAVAEGYRGLARAEPARVRLIDAAGSRDEVFQRILTEVHRVLAA